MAWVGQAGDGDEVVVDRLLKKRVVLPQRMVGGGEIAGEQGLLARFEEFSFCDPALVDADKGYKCGGLY